MRVYIRRNPGVGGEGFGCGNKKFELAAPGAMICVSDIQSGAPSFLFTSHTGRATPVPFVAQIDSIIAGRVKVSTQR